MPDSLTDLGDLDVGAEDFLAAVLQAAAQPIWVVDPDGLIRFANPAAVAALGYESPAELFGRPSHDTIHFKRPDGTRYPAGSYVSVPLDMSGGRGAVVAFTDIELRLRAERALREREATLAEQQRSLRRVASLVARGAPPQNVFEAVVDEVAHVLHVPRVELSRFDDDGTLMVVAARSDRPHPFRPGTRWPLEGPTLSAQILATGRPTRIDDFTGIAGRIADAVRAFGIRSGAGAPINVDGQVWGMMATASLDDERLAEGIEDRLADFTALVATAISHAQAREDLRRLADQEAALRRLATLVAKGAEPRIVFDAVCKETGRLLGANSVNLAHFTADGLNVTMAGWSAHGVHVPTGTRFPLEGDTINALVRDTAAPGRFDSYEGARGELAAVLRRRGVRSEVGAPVVVEGRVWGALIAGTDQAEPLPAGAEHRLAGFAELVATAISNTTARTELVASRARIVAAADEQRRRVVRDLHDGAQQRLVTAVMTFQRAQARSDVPSDVQELVRDGLVQARAAIDELRELAHGIHPAILTHHGLAAAIDGLAERAPLPVDVDVPDDRFPAAVESAAYFVAAESLTNVAKYAQASTARVAAVCDGDRLVLSIEDDGIGGASPTPGSGLSGLVDRVTALAGTLTVDSAPGGGTCVRAVVPFAPQEERRRVSPIVATACANHAVPVPVRVLLVDDDDGFRRSAAQLLAERGYDVVGQAGTVAEARSAIGRLRPDALLLDVNLPDGNGAAFATELSRESGAPRLLLTSTDPSAVTRRLLERCGAGFVVKTDLMVTDLRALLG